MAAMPMLTEPLGIGWKPSNMKAVHAASPTAITQFPGPGLET